MKGFKSLGRGFSKQPFKQNVNLTGRTFESLEILEVLDNNVKGKGHKLYKARCYLCGKEFTVFDSKFRIWKPSPKNSIEPQGWTSGVYCNCHEHSSFQWKVNKLLFENKVPYRVEYSFPGLYGAGGINLLRFDFAVFNRDGSLKCLIECQGEQHYQPVEEFGGEDGFQQQVLNDNRKREYAKAHNIKLIEISYLNKGYKDIKAILASNGIVLPFSFNDF